MSKNKDILLGAKDVKSLATSLAKKEKDIIKMFDKVDKLNGKNKTKEAIEALIELQTKIAMNTTTFQLLAAKWTIERNIKCLSKLALSSVTAIGVLTDKALVLQKKLEEK